MLNAKTRGSLEKLVRAGAPPHAAALSLGIRPKQINEWLALGMSIDQLGPRPKNQKEFLDFADPAMAGTTAGDWYEHRKQCKQLADLVCKIEGSLVSQLVRRMWVRSQRDGKMQTFLFNQFAHTTGLPRELPLPVRAKSDLDTDDSGGDVRISVVLPDNGRRKS